MIAPKRKPKNHSGDNSVIEVNTSTYAQSPKSRQPVNTDRYVDESLNEVLRTLINNPNKYSFYKTIEHTSVWYALHLHIMH